MIFLALLVLLVLPSLPPTKKTTSAYRGGIFVLNEGASPQPTLRR